MPNRLLPASRRPTTIRLIGRTGHSDVLSLPRSSSPSLLAIRTADGGEALPARLGNVTTRHPPFKRQKNKGGKEDDLKLDAKVAPRLPQTISVAHATEIGRSWAATRTRHPGQARRQLKDLAQRTTKAKSADTFLRCGFLVGLNHEQLSRTRRVLLFPRSTGRTIPHGNPPER